MYAVVFPVLALYELYKLIIPVKGSIVECGVFRGFGFMTWVKLAAILEPVNFMRKIYGFDTFSGFPTVSDLDTVGIASDVSVGDLFSDSYSELQELVSIHDSTRFLGHMLSALFKGNCLETILPSLIIIIYGLLF